MYCKPARKGETTQKLLCLYQLQLKLLVRWGPLVHQRDKKKNSRKNQEISRSITVQRGNAASIIGTLGHQRKLEEYFAHYLQLKYQVAKMRRHGSQWFYI